MNRHFFKAALFDLDGVVINTEPQYSVFWGAQGKEFHPEMADFAEHIKGQTLTQIYAGYFSGPLTEVQPIINERLAEFEANMQCEDMPGVTPFLKWLNHRGVRTAVVTSSNQEKMSSLYRKRPDLKELFDVILTAEDFAESKPHPDCYQKAAARLLLSADECLVFEDSFNGLKAGRAAGMKVVGLTTTNKAELIADLSDWLIADFSDTDLLYQLF